MEIIDVHARERLASLMAKYDTFTFKRHMETDKLHIFQSRFDEEKKCMVKTTSICNEKVKGEDSESINVSCKPEKTILQAALDFHLKGEEVCGVCMSVLYGREIED